LCCDCIESFAIPVGLYLSAFWARACVSADTNEQ
jgi:hypothetical protein